MTSRKVHCQLLECWYALALYTLGSRVDTGMTTAIGCMTAECREPMILRPSVCLIM